MSDVDCVKAWYASKNLKTRTQEFDKNYPGCCCEGHSFSGKDQPLLGDEKLARILTSPGSYTLDTKMIIWTKLVRVFTDGLSLFRPGWSEREVRQAVERLLNGGAEPQILVGAAVLTVSDVRALGNSSRWFCVYDTESLDFTKHADIAMTNPDINLSRTKYTKESEIRVKHLRDIMDKQVVIAGSAEDLISKLRSFSFNII